MYEEDTIAAVATPPGQGGVSIVRISGPQTEPIAGKIFSRVNGKNGALRSHTLHHGAVQDPKTGEVLDEVLLVLMRKPRSYTGEDVAEIHCHGGPLLTRRILQLVLSCGVRHAGPGEFTKRAFLNGRLDLAQAEAVLDVIQARTETGMKLAVQQMHGELSKWVTGLREELLDILAQVEAAIDFPEEDIELLQREELVQKIVNLREKIAGIISSYEWGRLFREGAKVCIAGRPNVGKSSLLNALLGEERVIVAAMPGTTRDVIEESVNLGGLPVILWDTAGIHESDDPVESAGIEFSRRRLEAADVTLVVLDGSTGFDAEDALILNAVNGKKGLLVINKSDLPQRLDAALIAAEAGTDIESVCVSARDGKGIGELKNALRELLLHTPIESEVVLTNLRHKAALEKSIDGLNASVRAIRSGVAPDLVMVDLAEAKDGLAEVIGSVFHDDILEHIFTRFCIGK
jgi:tRNA modification GTPase